MRGEMEYLLGILRQLGGIDPEFPLQYAICLIEIALDEGLSLSDLSERTGLALSTVSRIVGALSSRRQKGTPYGLVLVRISPQERRRKEISLSQSGRAYLSGLLPVLRQQAGAA